MWNAVSGALLFSTVGADCVNGARCTFHMEHIFQFAATFMCTLEAGLKC